MDRQKLREELKRDEGIRLKPYQDSLGVTTIGVGRNLRDVGLRHSEVDVMLGNDIEVAISHALEIFPRWGSLPAPVQHVIVNMIFQLGRRGFNGFRRFISHVKCHNWPAAADELLDSAAARQAPARFERHAAVFHSL